MLTVRWARFLRLITRNRHVPEDAETRARIGTWAWLTGQDVYNPRKER